MCRNLKPLFNFHPPATEEEIYIASLQFIRKISGYNKPSKTNQQIFDQSVNELTKIVDSLLDGLVTKSPPKNREIEAEKAKIKFQKKLEALKSI